MSSPSDKSKSGNGDLDMRSPTPPGTARGVAAAAAPVNQPRQHLHGAQGSIANPIPVGSVPGYLSIPRAYGGVNAYNAGPYTGYPYTVNPIGFTDPLSALSPLSAQNTVRPIPAPYTQTPGGRITAPKRAGTDLASVPKRITGTGPEKQTLEVAVENLYRQNEALTNEIAELRTSHQRQHYELLNQLQMLRLSSINTDSTISMLQSAIGAPDGPKN